MIKKNSFEKYFISNRYDMNTCEFTIIQIGILIFALPQKNIQKGLKSIVHRNTKMKKEWNEIV